MRQISKVLAVLALFAASVNAADSGPAPSLDWQKVNLESILTEKLQRAIGGVLPAESFFVNVSIRLTGARPTERKGRTHSADLERVPLGKLNVDVVPPVAAVSPAQMDLFQMIQSAEVHVFVDDSTPDSKRELVTQIVESVTDPTLGEGKADIQIDKVAFKQSPAAKAEGGWRWWFTELKVPAAALLIALLVCAFGAQLFGSYRKLELRKIEILEARAAFAEVGVVSRPQPQDTNLATLAHPGQQRALAQSADPRSGVEAFRAMLRENPRKACLLIRQWLRIPSLGAQGAMAALPLALPPSEFKEILTKLSQEERRLWLQSIRLQADSRSIEGADAFIGAQVVEALLAPEPPIPPELQEQLLALSPREVVQMIEDDASVGPLIVSALQAGSVARVFDLLPEELARSVTQGTLELSAEALRAQTVALKTRLAHLEDRHAEVPFLDNTTELLRVVGPEKERAIFNLLAEAGRLSQLESAARLFFPAELIAKLPSEVIRSALISLQPMQRAAWLRGRKPEELEKMLSLFGAPGAKARAMLDAEMTELARDPARAQPSAKNADVTEKDFVRAIREVLKAREHLAAVESLLAEWLYEKSGGKVGALPMKAPRSAA